LSQQDDHASEVKKAQEILGLVFPPHSEPSELLEPREQALDLPSTFVATQVTPVLAPLAWALATALGRVQIDLSFFCQSVSQFAAVEGFVADQVWRQFVDKRVVEGLLDEHNVVFGTICNANGERETSAVCKRHNLCCLAGTAPSNHVAPLFAPT